MELKVTLLSDWNDYDSSHNFATNNQLFIVLGYWAKVGWLHNWAEGNKPFKNCKKAIQKMCINIAIATKWYRGT